MKARWGDIGIAVFFTFVLTLTAGVTIGVTSTPNPHLKSSVLEGANCDGNYCHAISNQTAVYLLIHSDFGNYTASLLSGYDCVECYGSQRFEIETNQTGYAILPIPPTDLSACGFVLLNTEILDVTHRPASCDEGTFTLWPPALTIIVAVVATLLIYLTLTHWWHPKPRERKHVNKS